MLRSEKFIDVTAARGVVLIDFVFALYMFFLSSFSISSPTAFVVIKEIRK